MNDGNVCRAAPGFARVCKKVEKLQYLNIVVTSPGYTGFVITSPYVSVSVMVLGYHHGVSRLRPSCGHASISADARGRS